MEPKPQGDLLLRVLFLEWPGRPACGPPPLPWGLFGTCMHTHVSQLAEPCRALLSSPPFDAPPTAIGGYDMHACMRALHGQSRRRAPVVVDAGNCGGREGSLGGAGGGWGTHPVEGGVDLGGWFAAKGEGDGGEGARVVVVCVCV